jgi:hypothetical protein
MRPRFSYAHELADTTVYDDAMTAAVAEMQSRYEEQGRLPKEKYLPGVINAETKYVMGYLKRPPGPDVRPLLLTVCGTGVPGWVGPDADTARAVENKYRWQWVGYPAAVFPMGKSVDEGYEAACVEFERMEPGFEHRRRIEQHGVSMIGYSQGAVITSKLWKYAIEPEGGRLHWAKQHMLKAVTFGNPMREQGKAWADPGAPTAEATSHGIADELLTNTPPWWRDYAHRADLYTDCSGQSAEDKTAIYKFIMNMDVLSGPDSILAQVLEILNPKSEIARLIEITAMFKALWDAGLFFVHQTGPHVNYNIGPAIDYLRAA